MMNRGMMGPNGYPSGGGGVCGPVGMESPDDLYVVNSRGVGVGTSMHDDDHSAKTGFSDKDKGRGSYKCGRVSFHLIGLVSHFYESMLANASNHLFVPVCPFSVVFPRKDMCVHINQRLSDAVMNQLLK